MWLFVVSLVNCKCQLDSNSETSCMRQHDSDFRQCIVALLPQPTRQVFKQLKHWPCDSLVMCNNKTSKLMHTVILPSEQKTIAQVDKRAGEQRYHNRFFCKFSMHAVERHNRTICVRRLAQQACNSNLILSEN
jgi:hypothetical protein